jgi:hypothetical protein
MVDIQTVSIVIASASVVVGVIYYAFQIRHQSKVRQTDLIMRLHSQTVSKEFMEAYQKATNVKFDDYDDFVKKYGSLFAEGPEQTAILMCAMFMESMGVLLHKRLVDVETITELFPVEMAWKRFEPIVTGIRRKGTPESYKWFEYLHNEMKKREQTGVKNG